MSLTTIQTWLSTQQDCFVSVEEMKHLRREISIDDVANNKSSDHESPHILVTPSQYRPTMFPRNKGDLSGSQENSTGSICRCKRNVASIQRIISSQAVCYFLYFKPSKH